LLEIGTVFDSPSAAICYTDGMLSKTRSGKTETNFLASNCAIRVCSIAFAIAIVIAVAGLAGPAPGQSVGGVQPSVGSSSNSGALPAILKGVNFEQRLGTQIPLDATFKDENGKTVALRSYFGRTPVVLILAYYRCPMLCSEILSGATSSFKKLNFSIGDQFTVLTVSFDPTETPTLAAQTKRLYVKQYGDPAAASSWHFLTGQKSQIDRLTEAVGFHYAYIPQTKQYAHAAGIVVLTPAGKVGQYFYGIRFPERDLRLALVQSSRERIGSPVDQLLLFCCTYDPDTGRYQALIGHVLQIVGAVTILLIGTAILILYRSESKRKGRGTQAA
jgi:protein SCO1